MVRASPASLRGGSFMRHVRVGAVAIGVALISNACGSGSPTSPTGQAPKPAASLEGAGRAANSAPILILKTKPAADKTTTPYWTISGVMPLTVRFNLCPSDDVDQVYGPTGIQDPRFDTLNWQFNFGDPTTVPPSPDHFNKVTGKPQFDMDQTCRVDHVYERAGSFLAMVAVTDKHQEDQLSRGVTALARTTQFIRINVL